MPLDATRFPNLSAYLQSLPQGLASYPECKAKGTLVRGFVADLAPGQIREAGLPAELEALLLSPPNNSSWVAETYSWSGIFAVTDLLALDEAAWERWIARKNRELFTNPVLKVVMNFTSPRLALTLSSAYWGVLHHGSHLQIVENGPEGGRVTVDYPEKLFNERAARSLAVAFAVALELSRAHHASVVLEGWTPTRASFLARWS